MKKYHLLIMMIVVILGCSKSVENRYEEAKALETQSNFVGALEVYEGIVSDKPESAIAESSQYRIAVIYNNQIHDMAKSAHAYRKLHDMFPQSKNGPISLFLSGFLFNNELKNHDSAKAIYEMFLKEYPDNELAQSAQFELQTMGKDPMEFIKKDTTQTLVETDSSSLQKIQ